MQKPKVLLAYGEKEFSSGLKKVLEERNYKVAVITSGPLPKDSYDFLLHLGRNPADLTEGTRRLLEKMVKDRTRFFLVSFRLDDRLYRESLRFAESLTNDFEQKFGLQVNLLRLGRLFGPKVTAKDSGALGFLLQEFLESKQLTLYGEGKEVDYYLFESDAFLGIAQALAAAKSGITYAIAPPLATSSLAIAKLLGEIGGERHEIHWHRGLVAEEELGAVEGQPLAGWKEKISLQEGILKVLGEHSKIRPKELRQPAGGFKFPTVSFPRISLPKLSPKVLKIALVVFILLSPLIYLGGETVFAFFELNQTKLALESFDFGRASSSARAAEGSFGRLELWGKIIPFFKGAAVGKEAAAAAADLTANGGSAIATLENLLRSRQGLTTQPQDLKQFRDLSADFGAAQNHLTAASIEAEKLSSPFPKDFIQKVKEGLENGLLLAKLGQSFWEEADELLGYRGERSYLILFENSTELRSSGGFIGSLAKLTLENGGIKNLQFYDSYQFDSAGRVAAPASIVHFVNSPQIPLREVTLDPSFPQAARDAAQIFSADQKTDIEGVAGATLVFAQDLLGATGSLDLPEFQKTVTAENLFPLATQEVELGFFPGSTQKKRFMQALGEGLIQKLFSIKRSEYAKIGEAILQSLKQKNLLLYFPKGPLAQETEETNIDGRLAATTGDYLAVFDNNYSAKVNGVFIKRQINYRVYSPDKGGKLRGDVTITWNHTGTDAWPSNSIYNALLVAVPAGSTLLGAKLNGGNYDGAFTIQEEGKTELVAYFLIPHSAVTTFELIYALPPEFDFATLANYQLIVQKQPGTEGDHFSFAFEKTFGNPPSGDTSFDGKLDQDLKFKIQLKQE